ncbi:MAG: transglutaminase-like domain-containing protein [Acidobacteriota bacterium]
MPRLRTLRAAFLPWLLAVLSVAPALASDEPSGTLWYRIEIDGAPAGWSMERIAREGDRVTTTTRLALRLRRGTAEIRIELASRFVETDDGEPVLLWRHQTLGRLPVESTFRFGPDGIESVTGQAGRETRETLPRPRGEWLPPDAARRATVEHLRAGTPRFTLRVIDSFQGLEPVTIERERLGPGTVPGAVGRWRERTLGREATAAVNEGTLELDGDGRLLTSSTTFLGMELSLHRTDRRSARAVVEDGVAPELMVSTFVRPDRPIPEPRRLRRAAYELILPPDPGGAPAELPMPPRTDAQRARRIRGEGTEDADGAEGADARTGGDRVRVVVDATGVAVPRPPADADGAPPGPDRRLHLAASPYLDHHDPAVRALLSRLDRPAPGEPTETPRDRALRLAALVHGSITEKTLDTGFATASEVARTGTGDCTEHAVLLAALLRADGIPSRVVSGLVYLEEVAGVRNVFGYHMWTQALIDGRWLDLDATAAPPEDPDAPGYGFDATHIALAVSALAGPDATGELLPLTPLVGRLEIRVVEMDRAVRDRPPSRPPRPPSAPSGRPSGPPGPGG